MDESLTEQRRAIDESLLELLISISLGSIPSMLSSSSLSIFSPVSVPLSVLEYAPNTKKKVAILLHFSYLFNEFL
ncbi:hypothetical protein [Bacillus sp. AFS040349]|uniref:hypothetical protein n=1 Tax=Bacillus sp. AFS040349 TaxID=2033502 RepID=UPI001C3F1517|nr:hypothetical protein [Bacillus sp. AFS040349]